MITRAVVSFWGNGSGLPAFPEGIRPRPGLNATLRHKPGKMLERPVIGALRGGREKTRGDFSAFQMIAQAVTAHSLAGTGRIAAVAVLQILILLTIHDRYSPYPANPNPG